MAEADATQPTTTPDPKRAARGDREALAGLVERVTFHNPESGFCVLRVKARGQRDLVTIVGHVATISVGEFVQANGAWVNDRTHRMQFNAAFLRAAPPTTLEGIERYLGSGLIKGIGPVSGRKLVAAFGESVFEVIEQQPERLREVDRIGPKRAERIVAGWADQKVIREIMLFLHSHGVGTLRAVRIFKTYGADQSRCRAADRQHWAGGEHGPTSEPFRDCLGRPSDRSDSLAGIRSQQKTPRCFFRRRPDSG